VPELGEQAGWQALGFMGGSRQTAFNLLHYLLVAPIGGSPDITVMLPPMIAFIDAYQDALGRLPFLTPASAPSTHRAPMVKYQYQKSRWGTVDYHALIFKLALELNL